MDKPLWWEVAQFAPKPTQHRTLLGHWGIFGMVSQSLPGQSGSGLILHGYGQELVTLLNIINGTAIALAIVSLGGYVWLYRTATPIRPIPSDGASVPDANATLLGYASRKARANGI